MKQRLWLLLWLLLFPASALAQTTVTGTIVDPNSNPYANGTASAILSVPAGQVVPPPVNTTTDSVGHFTMTLPQGSYIFTICALPTLLNIPTTNPTPKQVCFRNTTPIFVSGGSEDVSSVLNAVAAILGPAPGGGGGGGGTVGPGTVPHVAVFTAPTTVGDSTITDPSPAPTRTPDGLNTATSGNYDEWTVDTGGVVANELACRSSVNKVQICGAGVKTGVLGVAQATVSSGGTVEICWAAKCSVTAATNFTAGDWMIPSVGTAGQVDDSGATEPTGTQTFQAESTGTNGQTVNVTILSLDSVGASAGTNVQSFPQTTRTVLSSFNSSTGIFGGSKQSQCTDTQSGASYTVPSQDFGCVLVFTGSSAASYTLPQAGSTGFDTNWDFTAQNAGSANVTYTSSVSTFSVNGAAPVSSFTLSSGQYAYVYSPDNVNYNVLLETFTASSQRRVCMIIVGTDDGGVLSNSNLGPQGGLCYLPYSATIVEIMVTADAGTPNVIPGKNHLGTITNLVSSALATAASGGRACSNIGGTQSLDGSTTCSATLQNTSVVQGDFLNLVSGTAGGTAKRMSIAITFSVQ